MYYWELQCTSDILYALGTSGFMAHFIVLILWDLLCKGIGLWKAARSENKHLFIAIQSTDEFTTKWGHCQKIKILKLQSLK